MQIRNPKGGPIGPIVLLIVVIFLCTPGFVEGASVIRTDKADYDQGEMIRVRFSNAPGYNSDWICIAPAGSPDTEPGDYKYMPLGVGQGILTFGPLRPGNYEVRAYYNYRRNGYVVSGRYPFSVGSAPVIEGAAPQPMAPIGHGGPVDTDFPPPVAFDDPPHVVVLPGTDVYIVPNIPVDIFFHGGWWWRQWRGNWYRSQFYNRGWAHHHEYPSWHRRVPHNWRHNYQNHIWGGRPWNPPRITHGNLNNHWREGHWRRDHGLGRSKPSGPPGGQALHGGGRPGRGPEGPAVSPVGPRGGRPGGGPEGPAVSPVGPGGGKSGGGSEKPAVRTGGPGGGRPGGGGHSDRQGPGDGPGRGGGDRR